MTKITDALNQYAKSSVGGRERLLDESHFYDFRQNIFGGKMDSAFIDMFQNGDGNELSAKACAVHSSSMLGYNFFHWVNDNPITINWEDGSVRYEKVLFEVKMGVLNGRSNPANMDIVLTNASGDYLFIESKFLEYSNTESFKIADAYEDEKRYIIKDGRNKSWAEYVTSLLAKEKTNRLNVSIKHQYWGGIKQEISHMIALMNWMSGRGIGEKSSIVYKGGNIRFINLVFDPNHEYGEYESFENYMLRYKDLYEDLDNKGLIPENLITGFMTYSQMWDLLKAQMNPDLRSYLWNHYMKFSNATE